MLILKVKFLSNKDLTVKNKFISKNFLEEKENFRNKILIENFPTRAEIYTLLTGFTETNNILLEYTTVNRTKSIEISFKNTVRTLFTKENANQFLELLNKLKLINPLYSKLKAFFISIDSNNNKILDSSKKFIPEESFIIKNNVYNH